MNIKRILFAALCCVMTQVVLAQAKRISGTVTDADGPVMMANVVEVDAGNRIVSATQTDFNGNFSMQVKSPKNKLKFSYVGDKTIKKKFGKNAILKGMNLEEGATAKDRNAQIVKNMYGGYYFLPKPDSADPTIYIAERKGLFIRKDWLEAVGMEMPTS